MFSFHLFYWTLFGATWNTSLEIICTYVNSFGPTIRGKLAPSRKVQVSNCKIWFQMHSKASILTLIDGFKRHVTTLKSSKFTIANTTDLLAFP